MTRRDLPAPRQLLFTVYRLHRGAWTVDGKPMEQKPVQKKCSHNGPCSFPFKGCDGGVTFSTEIQE